MADEYGWPSKTNARLVARGGTHRVNIDFGEKKSLTVAVSIARLLTAIACDLNLDFCHFDI